MPYGFASSRNDEGAGDCVTKSPFDRRLTLVAITLVAALAYSPCYLRNPHDSDWYRCFVRAAERMQNGETIHVIESRPYAYPPIMAFLTVPLATLPLCVTFPIWYALNVLALCTLVATAWRLSGGDSWRSLDRRNVVTVIVGIVLMSRFLVSPLETRQFDLIIAALLVGGLLAIRNGRDVLGPLTVGLAAGMKCTPLIFAPYLAWSGRWKCASLVVATALTVNILPDVCYPQSSGRWYLEDWKSEFLDVAREMPPGTWFSGLLQNQSLAGQLQRLFRYGVPSSIEEVRTSKLSPELVPALRAAYFIGCGALIVVTWMCIAVPVGSDRPRPDGALEPHDFRRYAAEVSSLLALMLLLSPMTSRAHYVVLVVPVFLATKTAFVRRSPETWLPLAILLVCGPLTSKGLMGSAAGEMALAAGLPVLFALTCLFSSGRILVFERRLELADA